MSSRRRVGPSRPSPQLLAPSPSLALVVVDAGPLRHKQYKLYTAKCRELARLQQALKSFEDEHVPAFTRWMEGEFAALLADLRRTEIELRDLHDLVQQIEDYADWQDVPLGIAYQRIIAARAGGTEEQLWRRSGAAGAGDFAADFTEAFSAGFGDLGDEAGPAPSRPRLRDGNAEAVQAQLKGLYRQLVRLLHPDTNADVHDQEQWQAVQEAYAQDDLERLQRLYRAIAPKPTGAADVKTGPIGDIISLRRSVEKRLRQVRKSLKDAWAHPASDFAKVCTTAPRLRHFKQQIAATFSRDLQEMQQARRAIEAQLAQWLRQSQRQRERRQQRAAATRKSPSARTATTSRG